MQPPERFINHRCDPNTFIRTIAGDRYVVALREIHPGDEITYDYCINGDGDTAWDCSCKSPECRKRHLSGFFHLPWMSRPATWLCSKTGSSLSTGTRWTS